MFNETSKFGSNGSGAAQKIDAAVPGPRSARSRGDMPSIVSAGLQITGNMSSDGDMQIEGTVEGDLICRMLTVGEGAIINGWVTADEVAVSGTVSGRIKARNITLSSTARVTGNIFVEEHLIVRAETQSCGDL